VAIWEIIDIFSSWYSRRSLVSAVIVDAFESISALAIVTFRRMSSASLLLSLFFDMIDYSVWRIFYISFVS
jgi:hypothetical protein